MSLNKRGADKVIAMYWFVILIIVAGGVFAMVYSFYNHPYDVREVEAELMVNRIADCISYGGKINNNLFDGEEFDESFKNTFYDDCNINFNVESQSGWEDEPQYFLRVNFYDASNYTGESLFEISKGEMALTAGCEIQNEKEYEKEVKCVEDSFFSLDNSDNLYLIKILSIVKKTEKNVK